MTVKFRYLIFWVLFSLSQSGSATNILACHVDLDGEGVKALPHFTGEVGALSEKRIRFLVAYRNPKKGYFPFKWPPGVTLDNKAFITKAYYTRRPPRQLFFEVENAAQKKLNDTLKRKSYVDALNNKFKEILLKNLGDQSEIYAQYGVTALSDYKGVRLVFEGFHGDEEFEPLKRMLASTYGASVREFSEYVKSNHLIYRTDDPTRWFRGGIGTAADRATFAARLTYLSGDPLHTGVFEDPEVESKIGDGIRASEGLRQGLAEKYPQLFENINNLFVPRAEVFDVARKISNPRELRNILAQRYGLKKYFWRGEWKKYTWRDARDLQNYTRQLSLYVPSVLSWENKRATLDNSPEGGFSLDLIGQGGNNLQAAAYAIQSLTRASAKNIPTEAFIQTLRRQDIAATSAFNARKMEISHIARLVFGEVAGDSSGDEIVVVPNALVTDEKIDLFFDKLAKNVGTGFRILYVDGRATPTDLLDSYAAWADGQAVILRNRVEGIIPHKKLRNLIFDGVVRQGKLTLSYHSRSSDLELRLTPAEERRLKYFMEEIQKEEMEVAR